MPFFCVSSGNHGGNFRRLEPGAAVHLLRPVAASILRAIAPATSRVQYVADEVNAVRALHLRTWNIAPGFAPETPRAGQDNRRTVRPQQHGAAQAAVAGRRPAGWRLACIHPRGGVQRAQIGGQDFIPQPGAGG